MLEAHYATADDIDIAMKQGCALPMGPFELLDVVGNDVSLAIQRELYLEFREPGFAPAPLLEHLVTAGYLGRKTKRGFRDYSARCTPQRQSGAGLALWCDSPSRRRMASTSPKATVPTTIRSSRSARSSPIGSRSISARAISSAARA